MRKTTVLCVFLLLVTMDASACPSCTYERVMPTWRLFAGLRLAAVCMIAFSVLDVVRTLQVFVLYELLYYHLWRISVWGSYSESRLSEWMTGIFHLATTLGIAAAVVLWAIGRIEWFRRRGSSGVTRTRAMGVALAMTVISVVEGVATCR